MVVMVDDEVMVAGHAVLLELANNASWDNNPETCLGSRGVLRSTRVVTMIISTITVMVMVVLLKMSFKRIVQNKLPEVILKIFEVTRSPL